MAALNYKHLGYFRTVAHVGNLTRAAEQLNVSQSALSVQIKKLEEHLGHSLFQRRNRSLHLTEAGRIALDHADTIFATGDELLGTLGGQDLSRPRIRVGAMATLSRNFQFGLLRPLFDGSDIEFVLRSGTPESLLADLEVLNLDIVLLNAAPTDGQGSAFRAHRLVEQQVSLIGKKARIGKKTGIDDLIANNPLILPTAPSSIRTGFDALVQQRGLRPNIVAEADDMAMLRLLTREDIGVGVLPPVVVRDEIAAGTLIEAHPLPGVFETFYAVTIERRFPNPLIRRILDAVSS